MDSKLNSISLELRAMESDKAASWLTEAYPIDSFEYGAAFQFISCRSWKRADQVRLARYYLQKIPFASAKAYEAFVSFMALRQFFNIIKERLPSNKSDIDLLIYHLRPTLENAVKTNADRELVDFFLAELNRAVVK